MSPIRFHLALKYLVDIRLLTPLIIRKSSKKWWFLTGIFQLCPVSGQWCPDGWWDGHSFYFKTFPTRQCFERCITFMYPICRFLVIVEETDARTGRQIFLFSKVTWPFQRWYHNSRSRYRTQIVLYLIFVRKTNFLFMLLPKSDRKGVKNEKKKK